MHGCNAQYEADMNASPFQEHLNMAKISVITVTYNSAKTIERTLKSVLSQTAAPYEHIIMDCNSDDDTVGIIEGLRQKYVDRGISLRVISEPDKGRYDAMNKGIHIAQGDLIGILNSDDYYLSSAIEILQRNVEKYPDADIYMGAIYIHNGDHIVTKRVIVRKRYQTSRNFNHPAMFVRRQTYSEVGDYRSGNVHDDYDWYLKALKMGKRVWIIPQVMTHFTIGGVSSQKSFSNTLKRIGLKYRIYRENGYNRLYMLECIGQEIAKYILVKKQ